MYILNVCCCLIYGQTFSNKYKEHVEAVHNNSICRHSSHVINTTNAYDGNVKNFMGVIKTERNRKHLDNKEKFL
jgi:hypothetical protein